MGDETSFFQYQMASATKTMRNAPRFGKPSDFALLFSDNPDDSKDYALGLIFGGVLVLACFFSWCVALIICKCLGQRKVGFVSGAPFQSPENGGSSKRIFRIRLVYLTSGIIFIVFTILLVTMGITNIQSTVYTVSDSAQNVNSLMDDADAIARSLESLGDTGKAIRTELEANLGNFCPADPNLAQETGYDFETEAQNAIDLLEQLGDFIDQDVDGLQNDIDTVQDGTEEVSKQVDKIDLNDWQSLIIIIPYIILATAMLVGMILAWFQASLPIYTCLLVWLFQPLFILITVFAFAFAGGLLIAAVANADFCSAGAANTPDVAVTDILRAQGVTREEFVYLAIQFYVNQCGTNLEDPWDFIKEYEDEIEAAATSIDEFNAAVDSVSLERLNLLCGKDFLPLAALLDTMADTLDTLLLNAKSALDLVSCERIVPIYTNTFYTGTCTYSVTGITWTFASFLVIAFFGMLMITFRSVLWDVGSSKLEKTESLMYGEPADRYYEEEEPDGEGEPADRYYDEEEEPDGEGEEVESFAQDGDGFYDDDSSGYDQDFQATAPMAGSVKPLY